MASSDHAKETVSSSNVNVETTGELCAQLRADLAAANAKVAELENAKYELLVVRDGLIADRDNAAILINNLEAKCERLEKELATVRGGYEHIIAKLTRERDANIGLLVSAIEEFIEKMAASASPSRGGE